MTSPGGPGSDERTRDEELLYSVLFRRYLPYTRRLLWLRGVPLKDRDDVTQEAWIRVCASLDRYDPERLFEPWLRAIVVRTACDYFKQAVVRRERLSDTGEVEPKGVSQMEERMIDVDRTLEAALGQLSDEHREVFVLGEIEEMEAPEIAALLGVPVNTVYSRLSRAREQFARAVDRLRAAEQRRLGAAFVVPAFLVDWSVLVEHGREIPPVSAGTANAIWEGVVRGIQEIDAGMGGADGDASRRDGDASGRDGDASGERARDGARDESALPPAAPLPPAQPRTVSPSAPASPSVLARLPWSSPVRSVGAALIAGGLAGGAVVYGWMRDPPRPPVVAIEEARAAISASAAVAPVTPVTAGERPTTSLSTPVGPKVPVSSSATLSAYDPREELATLEAAWTLYFQGKCKAARDKLGSHTGRVHAKDYTDLRTKIEACLGRDGGAP